MSLAIPQVAVTQNPAQAIQGQIAEGGWLTNEESVIAEVAIAAGLCVVTGATAAVGAPLEVTFGKLPTVIGDMTTNFRGFAVYNDMKMPPAGGGTPTYAIGDCVPVMRRGRMWVPISGDVLIDGPCYVVYTGATAGQCRGDNTNATLLPNAKFLRITTAASGLLALLEVNT